MNTKERLLQEIEQAPDSLIEETLNFLLSAQASYAKSERASNSIILLLLISFLALSELATLGRVTFPSKAV